MANTVMTVEEIKRKIAPIFQSYPVKKAVLFGSYAKKTADHNSDIDLFIDSDGKLRGLDFVGLLEELVCALGREVDLFEKTHINPDSPIVNEIRNQGIILYERP